MRMIEEECLINWKLYKLEKKNEGDLNEGFCQVMDSRSETKVVNLFFHIVTV